MVELVSRNCITALRFSNILGILVQVHLEYNCPEVHSYTRNAFSSQWVFGWLMLRPIVPTLNLVKVGATLIALLFISSLTLVLQISPLIHCSGTMDCMSEGSV